MRFLVWVAVMQVGCKSHGSPPPPPPVPKLPALGTSVARGTLRRATVDTRYAVVVPAGADLDALEKLARKTAPSARVERKMLRTAFNEEQLALATKDLSQPDEDALKAASDMIVIGGTGSDGLKLARELAAAARVVADAAHGFVLDPETFKIYPATAFAEHVPGEHPDVAKLIMVHAIIGGNEQPFVDTAGLRRYGYPELYVAEFPSGEMSQVHSLVNAAAQALLDGKDVNERGEIAVDFHQLGWKVGKIMGTGKAVWKTRWAKERDSVEGDDLVVELVPPAGAGTEGVTKLINDCFGAEPEQLAETKGDDPELLAAGRRARGDLVKLRSHFAKGMEPDERLTVKARFTSDEDQTEWMWVDIVAFKDNMLEGTLANEPEVVTSLHDGQKVKVKLSDVADYIHEKKGAPSAGGYSIEVFKKRGALREDSAE